MWIVRGPNRFYVIYALCTHLGCTPNWNESNIKFKCPCHGSGYTREGINFEGPAPRPMERCKVTLSPDGNLLIDTSVRYRPAKWEQEPAYLSYA